MEPDSHVELITCLCSPASAKSKFAREISWPKNGYREGSSLCVWVCVSVSLSLYMCLCVCLIWVISIAMFFLFPESFTESSVSWITHQHMHSCKTTMLCKIASRGPSNPMKQIYQAVGRWPCPEGILLGHLFFPDTPKTYKQLYTCTTSKTTIGTIP